jgi:hypothetical protein
MVAYTRLTTMYAGSTVLAVCEPERDDVKTTSIPVVI